MPKSEITLVQTLIKRKSPISKKKMSILESVKVLEKAKSCLGFALPALEDVLHLDDAILNEKSQSEASYLMLAAHKMLRQIHLKLLNAPCYYVHEDDDDSGSGFLNRISVVADVCICTQSAILKYFEEAESSVQSIPAVNRISANPVNLFALHNLTIEMTDIISELHSVTDGEVFIMPGGDTARVISQSIQQSPGSSIEETWLIGYETHQNNITEKLLDLSILQCLQVAIVGPEASGKSALAQRIYQSTAVTNHFDVRFWLFDINRFDHQCRPELLKPIDILRKILITLEPKNSLEGHDEQLLVSRIRESLKSKRYLVVVDNVQMYDIFRKAMPSENNGSRVLITAQKIGDYEKICLGLDPKIIYELPSLTCEEWLEIIIRNHLEKSSSPEEYLASMLPPAKMIASSSWGSNPLNMILLSRHMLFNRQSSHSLEVLRGISAATTLSEFHAVIYSKLPTRLLTCFAYMVALFPANYLIHAGSLVRLWVAEAMIPREDGRTMEQTAELYLDELYQRGFVRTFWSYYHNQANEPTRIVVIHPLLRSGLFNRHTGIGDCPPVNVIFGEDALGNSGCEKEDDNHENFEHFRRLALHVSYECDGSSSFQEGKRLQGFKYRSLHSLFFFGSVAPLIGFELRFLRVLTVFQARIRFCEEDRPCWLDGLINLRYLGFIVCWLESGSVLGQKISTRLPNLHTLDLSESFVSGLAEFMEHNTAVNVIGPIREQLQGCWSPVPDLKFEK